MFKKFFKKKNKSSKEEQMKLIRERYKQCCEQRILSQSIEIVERGIENGEIKLTYSSVYGFQQCD